MSIFPAPADVGPVKFCDLGGCHFRQGVAGQSRPDVRPSRHLSIYALRQMCLRRTVREIGFLAPRPAAHWRSRAHLGRKLQAVLPPQTSAPGSSPSFFQLRGQIVVGVQQTKLFLEPFVLGSDVRITCGSGWSFVRTVRHRSIVCVVSGSLKPPAAAVGRDCCFVFIFLLGCWQFDLHPSRRIRPRRVPA